MATKDLSAVDVTRRGVQAFLAVKMLVLAINLVRFPLLSRADDTDLHDVSVLVPARDEADRLPGTLPAILENHKTEVLVLDDNSDDGTAEVACDLIERSGHPRARVLSGAPLPEGWTGKAWACQIGRAHV